MSLWLALEVVMFLWQGFTPVKPDCIEPGINKRRFSGEEWYERGGCIQKTCSVRSFFVIKEKILSQCKFWNIRWIRLSPGQCSKKSTNSIKK